LDNFTGFFDGAGPDVDMSTVRSVQKKLARIMNVMGLPVLAREKLHKCQQALQEQGRCNEAIDEV